MSSCNKKNARVVLSDRALEQVMRDLFSMTGCRPNYHTKGNSGEPDRAYVPEPEKSD